MRYIRYMLSISYINGHLTDGNSQLADQCEIYSAENPTWIFYLDVKAKNKSAPVDTF